MAEQDSTVEDAKEEAPDREYPISSSARFTIGGKPLTLDDFTDITTGDLSNRPISPPRPQPAPLPKEVIWNARRPLD